jgi:predicted DNA-binding mobile mystery protein A
MKNNLQKKQLNDKLKVLKVAQSIATPSSGWIKAIRSTLGMSLEQVGNKLGVSKQNIQSLEKREKEGSITLNSLREVARAMDMEVVYALVPRDESLDKLIERKAEKLAKEIVLRTTHNMALEDQENSERRILEAIEERKNELITTLPKSLWD